MSHGEATLESVYRELGAGIRAFLRRRLGEANAADELLQETFLAAARNPSALFAAASKRAWLIGIAANLVREHIRRKVRNRTAPLAIEIPEYSKDAEDARLDSMREAIARLPDINREVLELRLVEALSYAEIAESLELPIGTVRSRIHHAVLRLRNELTGKSKIEGGTTEHKEQRHVAG